MSTPSTQIRRWRIEVRRETGLPPMAWLVRAGPLGAAGPVATVRCGELVSSFDDGVFEGTWVGNPGAAGIMSSTTTFGSGVLVDQDGLRLVPPSHLLENVYLCRKNGEVIASNSLVALLVAADLALEPETDYPRIFGQSGEGVLRFTVPTTRLPIEVIGFDGIRISPDGEINDIEKPREPPFESYADLRGRLSEALRSSFANAPDFDPVATISSGYDSASMATLASELGCRRAITVVEGKPVRGSSRTSDSGEAVARHLGMEVQPLRRLAYLERDDFPEAEFLATGATGEDIALSEAGPSLNRSLLITGFFGDGMWWLNRPRRELLWRLEQAGMSLGEWRLRTGFIHVPLPWFGAPQMRSIAPINHSPEMAPFVLGMDNDRPIPRRILEEAGIERGTFADAKRATSATIHSHGPASLSVGTRAAVEAFAAAEGRRLDFRRRGFPRWRKLVLRVGKSLHQPRIRRFGEGPKLEFTRHQPRFGNLLLRWAVSVVAPRYRALR